MTEGSQVTPHGELLNAARLAKKLSQRAAARKAEISEGRWRQIVTGVQRTGGVDVPVNTRPETLRAMADAVGADWRAVLSAAGFDPETVGAPVQDAEPDDTLLYRRPPGLSDTEWERLQASTRDYIQWQIDQAARER